MENENISQVNNDFLEDLMTLAGDLVLSRNRILKIAAKYNDTELNSASQSLNLATSEIQSRIMRTGRVTSLSIIPALIIVAGEERFAIPQKNLVELVKVDTEDSSKLIEKVGDAEFYRLRGSILPLLRLSETLGLSKKKSGNSDSMDIIVLNGIGRQFGLIVDSIIDSEEIVVRQLSNHFKDLNLFSGATITGDGKIALILDILNLALRINLKTAELTKDLNKKSRLDDSQNDDAQSLLLFNISEEEQFAVPLALVSRLEKINVNDIDIAGGKEVIQYRGKSMPVIRIENYLQVSGPKQNTEGFIIVFELNDQDVGLYVSKIIDAMDVQVNMDKETFARDGLLGSMIIHEKVTLLLDVYKIIEMYDPTWFTRKRISKSGLSDSNKKKILLVEDSQFWRTMEKAYLELENFVIITAENGEEALNILDKNEFDMIIVDLDMPIMNGFEFTQNLRVIDKYENIPVIAVTGLTDEDDRKKAFDSGVNEYILKLEKELLLSTLKKYCNKNISKN